MPGKYMIGLRSARKDAHMTQEQAAEAADISLESWKAYEYGDRLPPNEVIIRICDALDAPWLALEHMKESTRDLGVLPRNIRVQGISTAVLTLIQRARELEDDYYRLIGIAADGMIDEAERPAFDQIAEDIQAVVAAGLQVIYAREDVPGIKKDRLTGGAVRRTVASFSANNCSKNIIPHRRLESNPIFAKEGVNQV